MKLRKKDRQQKVLSEFRSVPTVRLGDLATQFGVTKETIRRDIDELSATGLLSRTYGGAVATYMNYEPSLVQRSRLNPDGRRRMAEVAYDLVKDDKVLMVDTGATVAHFCQRLAESVGPDSELQVTVVTNSLKNAQILADNGSIRTIVCPGDYDDGEAATFGPLTAEFVGRFNADVMVASAGSMDSETIMDVNSNAAAVKRTMMKKSLRKIFVIEGRKYGLPQFEAICPLAEIDDLVTDVDLPGDLSARLTKIGVSVHVPDDEADAAID
ncbi:DeoR/GlpR family DNA-binding transcription regulator [Bauldia sp.]|uniref:DeoR/GlpR family DNA-binding transcription regulator n=1 Tax=Bauldia sp. TaxID=2575872 RepID=UPI003BAA2D2E